MHKCMCHRPTSQLAHALLFACIQEHSILNNQELLLKAFPIQFPRKLYNYHYYNYMVHHNGRHCMLLPVHNHIQLHLKHASNCLSIRIKTAWEHAETPQLIDRDSHAPMASSHYVHVCRYRQLACLCPPVKD